MSLSIPLISQDLTEQLQEDGIARVEIQNDTLNVHWILHFMADDVREVLREDEVFKKAEILWKAGATSANTSHSVEEYGEGPYTTAFLWV